MKAKEDIVIEDREDEEWVYLYQFYKAEENVASRIIGLDNYSNIKRIDNFEKELQLFEKNSSIELSAKQKDAIKAINENNVCVITGRTRNWKNHYNKNYFRKI